MELKLKDQILQAPDVTELLATDGSRPLLESPQAFGAVLEMEIAKWKNGRRSARSRRK